MLRERYYAAIDELTQKIRESQGDAIRGCAEAICASLLADGAWHVLDTGHMLMFEAVGRSGGMMAIRPVRVSLEVSNPGRGRARTAAKKRVFMDEIEGLPDYVVEKSDMAEGDVLLIGSVSGINVLPVGVALAARARGLTTIALTSVEYSHFLQPVHPSGKRLCEVCDHVLDNCVPVGDTLVEVPELRQSMCPGSGMAASYIMWALQAEVVDIMVARGKSPHIYVSNHMPGAGPRNSEALADYEKTGF